MGMWCDRGHVSNSMSRNVHLIIVLLLCVPYFIMQLFSFHSHHPAPTQESCATLQEPCYYPRHSEMLLCIS